MSDIIKKEPTSIDNFEGWEDGVEGDDRPEGAGIIQGNLDKFANEGDWETREGEKINTDNERVPVNVVRVVQKWVDGRPVETITLEPHQKFPDIEELNEKTPREEWIEGPDGQLRGPWQAQHILYTVDPKTMDKYTFPTGSVGGKIAIRELRDKIVWMRRLRGPTTYPVIKLSRVWMNTRFGGRYRPHFEIVRWVRLGGEGGEEVEALPPPPATPQQTTAQSDLPSVQQPSLAEEMNDEIPDFGSENAESPKAAAPPLPNPRRNLEKSPAKTGAKKPPPKRNILDAG
jgi:hypothetical protein